MNKKLHILGTSRALIIPSYILKTLKVDDTTRFSIEFDLKTGNIVIKKINSKKD